MTNKTYYHGGLPPYDRIQLMAQIFEWLADPTVTVSIESGFRTWAEGYFRRSEPTNGRTVTITVHGGAKRIEGPPHERRPAGETGLCATCGRPLGGHP